MASMSLRTWRDTRLPRMDEIEAAHRAVGGPARGRRYATLQVNHLYAVLVSSQFQGFCRDLHSESVSYLVSHVTAPGATPASIQPVLAEEFVLNRVLDKGNPNPGNIGKDFNRLGVDFWGKVVERDPRRNRVHRSRLEELNLWRNAIAHQDFTSKPTPGGGVYAFTPYLAVVKVRQWRAACERLAVEFDAVMAEHLSLFSNSAPW
jgi:hypothetical protein